MNCEQKDDNLVVETVYKYYVVFVNYDFDSKCILMTV